MQKDELMDKYKKYAIMKEAGKTPHEIYLSAKTDGLDSAQRFNTTTPFLLKIFRRLADNFFQKPLF